MADRKAFVCGHPVRHSRSPLIHGYWLETYGLDGDYAALDVSPSEFPAFVSALQEKGYVGGNVTIPHKEAAAALVEQRTGEAERIGAVNTLWFEHGRLCGDNTDAYGFAANLDQQAAGWDGAGVAAVLGAGGAARAVIHALLLRGFQEVRVFNRTQARAQELANLFGPKVGAYALAEAGARLSGVGLVVNTTALGMEGEGALPVDPAAIPGHALVTDIVYVPLITPFLAAAQERGLRVADGLGMLLHQAAPGFERWFGKRPQVTPELRALIVADLEAHR